VRQQGGPARPRRQPSHSQRALQTAGASTGWLLRASLTKEVEGPVQLRHQCEEQHRVAHGERALVGCVLVVVGWCEVLLVGCLQCEGLPCERCVHLVHSSSNRKQHQHQSPGQRHPAPKPTAAQSLPSSPLPPQPCTAACRR